MRIIACLATTLDGKIASQKRPKERIGSAEDFQHLLRVRDQADAILSGGETFREWPLVRRGLDTNRPVPIQCILTRRIDLPPDAPVFTTQPAVPVWIFTPQIPGPEHQAAYPPHVQWHAVQAEQPVPDILATLEAAGIHTLLVEGGGHVMHLCLEARALQELYLTLCPLLLGGVQDPTLVTGPGFSVGQAPRTRVLSQHGHGQELYLHLALDYPPAPSP